MTVMGALAILDQKSDDWVFNCSQYARKSSNDAIQSVDTELRAWAGFRQAHGRLGDLFNLQDERAVTEISFPRPSGVYVVESLNFRYARNQNPVIADLHLELKSGFHCIVGPSGSGKSTLVKLLQGSIRRIAGESSLTGPILLSSLERTWLVGPVTFLKKHLLLVARFGIILLAMSLTYRMNK